MARPPIRGRGAADNPPNRFEPLVVVPDPEMRAVDDPGPRTCFFRDASRSIIARNDSPDIGFEASINPYRGCEHGCVYCLSGHTPILMSDGTTRQLADVRPRDAIYGVVRRGWYHRYVRTTVVAQWSVEEPAYRITLTGGTELVASGDHRFLTHRGWKHVTGRAHGSGRRPYLTANHKLMGVRALERRPSSRDIEGRVVVSDEDLRVAAVEPLDSVLTLFDITTGTGNFIADGVVSHNCYARPTHEYLGFSAGLDFESKILVKQDAPKLLRQKLVSPRWTPQTITLSGVTDAYQPAERRLRITRGCLEVLAEYRNPVAVVTKNHLVTRDIDLLSELARYDAAAVYLSVTTLDTQLQRVMEPRTSIPARRLAAIEALARAGVPVGVMVAPVIPGLTDHEMPRILEAAAAAGARFAGFTMLRLPYGVKDVFREWLERHFPERAGKVLHRVREMRGGRLNDPTFHSRMRGEGAYAQQLQTLFEIARRRLGMDQRVRLSTTAFRRVDHSGQLGLFDADA